LRLALSDYALALEESSKEGGRTKKEDARVRNRTAKTELKQIKSQSLVWVTYAEWQEQVESGFYQDHDCDGQWGCEFGEDKYIGGAVWEDDADPTNNPAWATHVCWYSK
jgi:hypothetical protein